MTIVVCAKGAGFSLMAADSLTEVSNLKMVRTVNSSKIMEFENFAVGMSGNGPIREVLELMHYEPLSISGDDDSTYDWRKHIIDHPVECDRFVQKFAELFRERGDEESLQTVELLLATPRRIFHTVADQTVFEKTDFWAVGSGGPFALGDMHRPYRSDMALAELQALLTSAIKTACFYSSGCQEPLDYVILNG